jgi:hypothetical protein
LIAATAFSPAAENGPSSAGAWQAVTIKAIENQAIPMALAFILPDNIANPFDSCRGSIFIRSLSFDNAGEVATAYFARDAHYSLSARSVLPDFALQADRSRGILG